MPYARLIVGPSVVQQLFRRRSFSTGDFHFVQKHLEDPKITSRPLVREGASTCSGLLVRTMSNEASGALKVAPATAAGSSATSPRVPQTTNRLAMERSPYLLQHARNPVDWYPWGQEAFDAAKRDNKLIFLSVGYATCHWCHVMEKESFEDEAVAELMNAHYVNIKVDREERPDVDRMYMAFVQATTGSGGWPMSVFLTPDLEPLAGGTYFPPEDMFGRPGFKTVLRKIAAQWSSKESSIKNSGKTTVEILRKAIEAVAPPTTRIDVPHPDIATKCIQQLSRSYDPDHGGFSHAPKFPQPANLNLLFHVYAKGKGQADGKRALDMCLTQLTRMAHGGIHDHVGGGFCRYSVDHRWHVPHFEKMLYDQGQLVVSYCDAYVVTKDAFYADVVRDVLRYVTTSLRHPLGGFYGAEDADSYAHAGAAHKREGAFYVWEYAELEALLSAESFAMFAHHFCVKPHGNVDASQDPHKELTHKNVLICLGSYEETAARFQMSIDEVKERLRECLDRLYVAREGRPKPETDTKMVTAWNALMISGFSKAGFVLKDQGYIDRAVEAANFVRTHLWDEGEKVLRRCCYKGASDDVIDSGNAISGFLDDYAFLIRSLLDLYEASLDADWLKWAEVLQEQQDRLFWDPHGNGYFTSPEGDTSILIRGKEDQDGAEPCGNSVAVNNLLRLAAYLGRNDLRAKAGRTLTGFAEKLSTIPIALPEMTSALLFYHDTPTQVFIAGEAEDNGTQALLDVVRNTLLPGRILAVADGPGGRAGLLYTRHETLARLKPIQGKPAAYVCRNFACSLPVTEPEALATSLDEEKEKSVAPAPPPAASN